jgi:hypothetical protein
MTIKTYVALDDGTTVLVETIEHEGDLWLVPKWIATSFPNMHKPARMIRMPKDRLQDLGHDFLASGIHAHKLDGQVSKVLLDVANPLQSDQPFDVLEAPELLIRR